MKGILTIDWGTIADTVLMAVIVAVLGGLVTLVSTGNFDLFTADWVTIGRNMTNLAFITAVVTFGKDLLSTNNGSLLGITPPNTP